MDLVPLMTFLEDITSIQSNPLDLLKLSQEDSANDKPRMSYCYQKIELCNAAFNHYSNRL